MSRRYQILYKQNLENEFGRLEPGVHRILYDKPEVNKAVALMTEFPYLAGIAVLVNGELFNITVCPPNDVRPWTFEFPASPA